MYVKFKHLDQINVRQQLCLDFSKVITIRSLFMWLFPSAKEKTRSVKDSTAYSYLNIIDINFILNH